MTKRTGQFSESSAGEHAVVPGRAEMPWIVVADDRVAKIFVIHKGKFNLIEEIHQPDLDISGLDNVGRGRGNSFGAGRHAYEPSMEESRQGPMALARQVTSLLEQRFSRGHFKALLIIAAPQMLGELRKNLGPQLSNAVIATSNKQIVGHSDQEMAAEIREIISELRK